MAVRRDEAKQKLIDAAVECIERYGVQNTTIRRIASQAGVNSAAISYYFGSRDELLNDVLEATLENAFQLDDIELPAGSDYRQALKSILEHWLGGAVSYPGIVRAHFETLNSAGEYRSMLLGRMALFIDSVAQILTAHGMPDTEEYRSRVRILFSAVLNSIIMPDLFGNAGRKDVREFIDLVVTMLD